MISRKCNCRKVIWGTHHLQNINNQCSRTCQYWWLNGKRDTRKVMIIKVVVSTKLVFYFRVKSDSTQLSWCQARFHFHQLLSNSSRGNIMVGNVWVFLHIAALFLPKFRSELHIKVGPPHAAPSSRWRVSTTTIKRSGLRQSAISVLPYLLFSMLEADHATISMLFIIECDFLLC